MVLWAIHNFLWEFVMKLFIVKNQAVHPYLLHLEGEKRARLIKKLFIFLIFRSIHFEKTI